MPLETLHNLAKLMCIGTRGMDAKCLEILIENLVRFTSFRLRSISEREVKDYDPFLVGKVRDRV